MTEEVKFSTTGVKLFILPLDFNTDSDGNVVRRLDMARNITLFEGSVWTGVVLDYTCLYDHTVWPSKYVDFDQTIQQYVVMSELLNFEYIDPITGLHPDPRDPQFEHVAWDKLQLNETIEVGQTGDSA